MIDSLARLKIVFLWHMHQPYYKDYFSGEYLLPWVRLHGLKDYLDMAEILEGFPKIKQTFNYVPSLVTQLRDYVDNDAHDRHLTLTQKKPADLSEADKIDLLRIFFSANYKTMIRPYPEYDRLYQKRESFGGQYSRATGKFTEQEYLDLTVLANLAWVDPSFRRDPDIAALFEKKKNFTLEERRSLVEFQKKILRRIIPKHRELQDRGQIEVSFSPYYHPILPLLIDTDLARQAMPRVRLPKNRFIHPEDARAQIQKSVELYRELFGKEQRGMWPSEGSVAEDLLPILAENNIKWIATDEEIFYQSLNQPQCSAEKSKYGSNFHRPFVLKRPFGQIGILFRDHKLSDRIGFVYSSWDPDKAANDFINNLASIRALIPPADLPNYAVPIILDGENAWEYFQNDGIDFLRCLYRQMTADKRFETVTVSELFRSNKQTNNIPYLFAGSWIGHNFKIWIGHEEDNKAWDLLYTTREALVHFEESHPAADRAEIDQAWEEIYIAEGSDWCWWYGDEHSSQEDDLFDIIFRSHLSAVYSIIGKDTPDDLLKPIRSSEIQTAVIQPSNFFSATIDGEVTHFYEWYDAGSFNCRKASSTMHRATNVVNEIFFGFDQDNFFYRLDLFTHADEDTIEDYSFDLEIRTTEIYRLRIERGEPTFEHRTSEKDDFQAISFDGRVALKNVVEISIPRAQIKMNEKFDVNLRVRVFKSDHLIETWPSMEMIKYQAPTEDKSIFWQV